MLAYNYAGRQHMMFGTDYPYTNHGPEHVEELPISAKDEAATRKRCSGWLERIKILVIADDPANRSSRLAPEGSRAKSA
jgi:hypothetical protein